MAHAAGIREHLVQPVRDFRRLQEALGQAPYGSVESDALDAAGGALVTIAAYETDHVGATAGAFESMFDYANCQVPAMRGVDAGHRIAAAVEMIKGSAYLLASQLSQVIKAGLEGDETYVWPEYDDSLQSPELAREGAAAVLAVTGPGRMHEKWGSVMGAARDVALAVKG